MERQLQRSRRDPWPWLALAAGFLAALVLAGFAFAAALCGIWDGRCTTQELRRRDLLALATIGTYLGVPVAVAVWRQQARWLLAPVVEAAGLAALVVVLMGVTSR